MNYSLQRTNSSEYCKRKLADDDDESLAGPAAAVSSGVGTVGKGSVQASQVASRVRFLPTGPQQTLE